MPRRPPEVIDAFADADVLDAPFALPEFGPGAVFPGAMAIGFHYVDYVVHGWDVARTLGRSYELPADVVAAALPLALLVPDGISAPPTMRSSARCSRRPIRPMTSTAFSLISVALRTGHRPL